MRRTLLGLALLLGILLLPAMGACPGNNEDKPIHGVDVGQLFGAP